MNLDDLTIGDAKKLACMFGNKRGKHFMLPPTATATVMACKI